MAKSKKEIIKTLELGGKTLTLSSGKLAMQAEMAVLAQYGETVVHATVATSDLSAELDYFPLTVEYQEKLYAGGRIKGSRWVKREGRPTDEEILKGRLIDRSIRPLFPKTYKKEVQVIITVLSVDLENDPAVVAPLAVSAALAASSIPWDGPISVSTVGFRDGKYTLNPVDSELSSSEMDLVVSSTRDAIIMIETGAKEVSEEDILGGIKFALDEGKKIIDFIQDFADAAGKKKVAYEEKHASENLVSTIQKLIKDKLPGVVDSLANVESGRSSEYDELIAAVKDQVSEEEQMFVAEVIDKLKKQYIRDLILGGKRLDGRAHDEIRPLYSEVGVLPRTHGSAIFQRGTTQVLSVATLGAPSMGQLLESAEGEEEKRYMHHYSMPPFSTGETGRVGSPSRREIGHGALAERAILPVLPSNEKFAYAIRVVSEVMSSNGSTSMASTCGSTLSLMDAGVPITAPVSGIAMGLIIKDKKEFAILSDIAGIEDFNGDMDFKVTGTSKGVTAMQLDVKTLNLTLDILTKALKQAKVGRAFILESMLKTISEPRAKVSTYAPKIKGIKINPEKIGEIIGPGGKNIKKIMAETGTQIDVEDDGSVSISGLTEDGVDKAITWIEGITHEVQPGEIYEDGVVKRLQSFGAFVEILPGKEGLVHVSDMAEDFVSDPADVVQEGDHVKVRVKEIDSMGRINLSMRMDPSKDKPRNGGSDRGRNERGSDRSDRGGFRGRSGGSGRPRFNRDRNDRNDRGERRGGSSGPHFPTSRFLNDSNKGRRFDR